MKNAVSDESHDPGFAPNVYELANIVGLREVDVEKILHALAVATHW